MTTITLPRATVEQALEALETCDAAHPSDGGQQWYDEKLVEPAITALRAALAQKAEPVEPVESALQAVAEKIGDQCAVWYGIGARDVEAVLREAARYGLVHGAQAEPVVWEGWWLHHGQHNYRATPLTSERVKELMKLAFEVGREATLPQQADPVEPVAWAFRHSDGTYHDPSVTEHSAGMVPLYTAPPQRKPLTKERLRDALVASRIIPPAAVEDPDEYDDGVTLHRIEALHRRIT